MTIKESYTAADTFPTKLLHLGVVKNGKIQPIHIQLTPTNACNLNCSFCSYSDRDKKKQIGYKQLEYILDVCADYGTKAMTITGGGEPLMYRKINELIDYAGLKEIDVGLVTNGTLLDRLDMHPNLTWCRISSSDDRDPKYGKIINALKVNPGTDWAFSHVVTRNPNYPIMKYLINFANEHNFTHVRLVSDLNDLENVPEISEIKKNLQPISDEKVIYQGRKNPTRGTKDCYISLLKPVIAPEGIFPCCGVVYAIHGQKKDSVDEMRMGKLNELESILKNQKHFDGSHCDKCYYSQYNSALKKLLNKPKHLKFV